MGWILFIRLKLLKVVDRIRLTFRILHSMETAALHSTFCSMRLFRRSLLALPTLSVGSVSV